MTEKYVLTLSMILNFMSLDSVRRANSRTPTALTGIAKGDILSVDIQRLSFYSSGSLWNSRMCTRTSMVCPVTYPPEILTHTITQRAYDVG